MANIADKLVGFVLMSGGTFIFLYYTLWVVILPFVQPGHVIHNFFPPRIIAVLLPVVAAVVGLTVLGSFVLYLTLSEKKKKKSS